MQLFGAGIKWSGRPVAPFGSMCFAIYFIGLPTRVIPVLRQKLVLRAAHCSPKASNNVNGSSVSSQTKNKKDATHQQVASFSKIHQGLFAFNVGAPRHRQTGLRVFGPVVLL